MSDFNEAIDYVLSNEGGFVDNPNDPGGATNFGISQSFLTSINSPRQPKDLTVDDAKALYQAYFWGPMKLDQINQQAATCMLDCAVNMGQANSVKYAQFAAGVAVDGVMGPRTISFINAINPLVFLYHFIGCVQAHYIDLVIKKPESLVFLEGWLARSRRMILLIHPV